MRLVGMLMALCALLTATHAGAQDTGEQASEEQLLALGPDVEATVGVPALAAPPPGDIERLTDDIAALIRCPTCQGMSVAESPSESARNMKHQVRALVAAGYDEAQILAYFEASYGEFIRLVPRAAGFNLLVWILPIAMFAVGLLFVVGFVKSMRGAEPPAAASTSAEPTGAEPTGAAPGAPTEDEDEDPWIAQVRRELADG